jgi:hypothetical protein
MSARAKSFQDNRSGTLRLANNVLIQLSRNKDSILPASRDKGAAPLATQGAAAMDHPVCQGLRMKYPISDAEQLEERHHRERLHGRERLLDRWSHAGIAVQVKIVFFLDYTIDGATGGTTQESSRIGQRQELTGS